MPGQRSVSSLNARDIPIKSVTVYTDRAEVRRTFQASLKPGLNEIQLENVADSIEEESISVEGKGDAVIYEVKFESKHVSLGRNDSPKAKELTTKLDDAEASIEKERDLQSVYTARLDVLNDVAKTIGQSSSKVGDGNNLVIFNAAAEASLEEFFDYHERKSVELKAKSRVVGQRIHALEAEIKFLQDEMKQHRTSKNVKSIISFEIFNASENDTDIELDVSYQVSGARWLPSYDIRVKSDRETHVMDISYFGNIQQQTGEDWTDVELSLSTAQPRVCGGTLPKLGTTVVQFYRQLTLALPSSTRPISDMKFRRQSIGLPNGGRGGARNGDAEKMEHVATTAHENVFSTTFTIPVRKSIASDSSKHKVTITVESLPVHLHYQCVPKKDTSVFLLATVINDSVYPILGGPATIYVNNSLSSKIALKSTSCGEKFELPLGVDETVKVIYKPTNKFQTQVGMVNKNSSSAYEQRIIIKNTKKSGPVLITLHESVPKSSDEKIKVRLIAPTLPSKSKETKVEEDLRIVHLPSIGVEMDDLNNLLWTEMIQPEHEKEFVVKWSVEYPPNETVEYVERSQKE